jgi:hypothetical protein
MLLQQMLLQQMLLLNVALCVQDLHGCGRPHVRLLITKLTWVWQYAAYCQSSMRTWLISCDSFADGRFVTPRVLRG